MLQLPTVKVRVVLSGVTAVLAWPEMVTVTSPVGSVASLTEYLLRPARHDAQRRWLYRHCRRVIVGDRDRQVLGDVGVVGAGGGVRCQRLAVWGTSSRVKVSVVLVAWPVT